jgi:hypothetical protein
MYDLFFVSYEEPNADTNWKILKDRFPHAKRVHGIKGIGNAHRYCAINSFTSMFWTVDGDTLIGDQWDFRYTPPVWDKEYLHLWYSQNPVNGLAYGYGAVKLWPRKRVLEHTESWLDFTTSVGGIKIIDQVIATTVFNTSEFESWKSAFRESVKLCVNLESTPDDDESRIRLETWMMVANHVAFASWCNVGANDAIKWVNSDPPDLSVINDFTWLRNKFKELHSL